MFSDNAINIFSSRDAVRNQLIEYAQKYLEIEGLDFTKTSYLSYLINVLSVLTSNLVYYNTATYREFFLTRAQQKESVLNLAGMIGYVPHRAIPATAELLVTFPIKFPSTSYVKIPGRHDPNNPPHMFHAGDIPFANQNEINIDVIIDRGRLLSCRVIEVNNRTGAIRNLRWKFTESKEAINFLIDVVQVEEVSDEFSFPQLRPYQFYNKFIGFSGEFAGISLITSRNGEGLKTWREQQSLFMVTPGENAYSNRVNDKGVTLYFGNNVIGTQPTAEDRANVTIDVTRGFDGNVISGSITNSDRLYIEVASENSTVKKPLRLSCINPAPAQGGRAFPSVDEIRRNAIAQVSTNNRMVSEHDFINASLIIEDLPIQNSIPILKRSDLKRSEIILYTDILFQENYVPTRNSAIEILHDDVLIDPDTLREYALIRAGEEVKISPSRYESEKDIEELTFVSIFDIHIDVMNTLATYYYVLDSIEKPLVIKQHYLHNQQRTIAVPSRANFDVEKFDPYEEDPEVDQDVLHIKFYYQQILTDEDLDALFDGGFTCTIDIDDTVIKQMTHDENGDETWFETTVNVDDLPDGDIYFNFTLSGIDSGEILPIDIFSCQTTTVVKNNLSDKMYSLVKSDDKDVYGVLRNVPTDNQQRKNYFQNMIAKIEQEMEDGTSTPEERWGLIYDVPLVRRDYLNFLKNENLYETFISTAMHRLITFDINPYRMLTDNVNLKFSNTTGTLTNMNYNEATKGFIDDIDPREMPTGVDLGYCVAVTTNENPWNNPPYNKIEGGFIARKVIDGWTFIDLNVNDIVWYDTVHGPTERNHEDNEKLIFNGENLYSLNKDIPLKLDISVWYDGTVAISEQGLVNNIKQTLIEYFIDKLGYDQNIYVSQIVKAVHSVEGVKHCNVLKPEHDIFFNYDLNKLGHEDLLRYSPQLVYMTVGNINIRLRKSPHV